MNDGRAFELFWEDTSLNDTTAKPWTQQVAAFTPADDEPRLLTYPSADLRLARPRDRLARVTARRHSSRAFGPGRLSARQLGSLLSTFASGPDGNRSFPSAGALYPLEIMCLATAVDGPDGPLDGMVLCHNPDNHSVNVVGPLAPWNEWCDSLNFPTSSPPPLVIVFVLLVEQMIAKYGSRGGRFALIEVGHAAQNLALRIAEEGLAGCEVGGTQDDAVLALLDLTATDARVALAYACGLPA
ncbi:MAG: SagB/ThcOx family dehydrogenase [Actinomycetota bacterium]|nr:SagB/ThcOx family dehydrogenase [Actinomycetota bacterium]